MSGTRPISVGNTTFLLDRIGLDCAPLQYVRELTQNSLEAIGKRRERGWTGRGQIVWDFDWALFESPGLMKLQISDNGCGMTGPQIESYINSLSSSGSEQGFAANFGVGAKISAGKENPVGLVYKSWVDGSGVMAHFWRDPSVGYGLRQHEVNGHFGYFRPVPPELKSSPIDDCGTSVTLLGNEEFENTCWKPELKQKWLIQYLNSRYFTLPDDVTILARDFSKRNSDDKLNSPQVQLDNDGSQMRSIRGMKHYLDSYCETSGNLRLSNAVAHWYLMPEKLAVSGGIWDESSHVAALFQSELYDLKRSHEARAELISFGIIYGHRRVVLYIEPDTSVLNVVSNTARSNLQIISGENSIPLPWADWAAEFRENIPQPIKAMMDQILSQADTGNYEDEVKKRLREIKELLRMTRYRRTTAGPISAAGELPGGASVLTDETREPRRKTSSKPKLGGSTSDLYAAFLTDEGDAAVELKHRDNTPKVEWVSIVDRTREQGDLEDKAARYIPEQNLIMANADFRGFQRVMEVLSESYSNADPSMIKQTVRAWSTLQLVEAVLGIQSLQGSPEWSSQQDLQSALSEEALTTVVMVRYASISQMRRQLGYQVGRAEQN